MNKDELEGKAEKAKGYVKQKTSGRQGDRDDRPDVQSA